MDKKYVMRCFATGETNDLKMHPIRGEGYDGVTGWIFLNMSVDLDSVSFPDAKIHLKSGKTQIEKVLAWVDLESKGYGALERPLRMLLHNGFRYMEDVTEEDFTSLYKVGKHYFGLFQKFNKEAESMLDEINISSEINNILT